MPAGEVAALEAFFRRDEPLRGAYLSRLFAFFSEEVVRHWTACEDSPYRDLGRPTVWGEDGRRHTLDFTLQRGNEGPRFVAEMKCEIQFENYRFLTLRDSSEIDHHVKGPAFAKLLQLAREPRSLRVTISGKGDQSIDGSILVWGIVTLEGRAAAIERFGFADVLSVEDMLRDLGQWQPQAWAEWINTRRRWSDELFEWLAYHAEGADSH